VGSAGVRANTKYPVGAKHEREDLCNLTGIEQRSCFALAMREREKTYPCKGGRGGSTDRAGFEGDVNKHDKMLKIILFYPK
jgi:hypothetical protein